MNNAFVQVSKEIVGYEEDYKKDSLSASDFVKLFYVAYGGYQK